MADNLSEAQNLVLGLIRASGVPGIHWLKLLEEVRKKANNINKSTVTAILKTLVERGIACRDVVVNAQQMQRTYWTKKSYALYLRVLNMASAGFSTDHQLAMQLIASSGVTGLNFSQIKVLMTGQGPYEETRIAAILLDLSSAGEIFMMENRSDDGNVINIYVDKEFSEQRTERNQR